MCKVETNTKAQKKYEFKRIMKWEKQDSDVASTTEVEEAESGNKNEGFNYIHDLENNSVHYFRLQYLHSLPLP